MGPRQDNEALERKLRPIYDALDARNWKAALKLADAALKKYKHNQLLRSLKSFALSKSGKQLEALQLCEELVKEGPEDELVLNTMVFTYKATGRIADITPAYLAATQRSPGNAELLNGLFAAYVRDSNYVKQQQTAARLVKAAQAGGLSAQEGGPTAAQSASKFTWWAVCSLVLQARAALLGEPSSLPADKLLQLAETMAMRSKSAGEALSYEELLLLLDILHGQGKHAEALQLLNKAPSESVPMEADRQQLRAAALARSGDITGAAIVYKSLALSNPDDWASWALYLDCMLPGSCCGDAAIQLKFPAGVVGGLAEQRDAQEPWREAAAAAGQQQQQQDAWQAVQSTLEELQAAVQDDTALLEQASRGTLRGPVLAQLEVALRRLRVAQAGGASGQQQGAVAAAEQEVAKEIVSAFRRTAGNSSCAADVRGGLAAITTPTLRSWLAAEVHAAASEAAAAASAETAASAAGRGEAEQSDSSSGSSNSSKGAGQDAAQVGESTAKQSSSSGGAADGGNANGAQSGPAAAELRRFQARVSAYQVEYELGLPAFGGPAEAEAHAMAVLCCYRDHMHLSAALDEKDRGYGEDLVCIAAAALLRAAQLEQDAALAGRRLLQALLVLEAAQVRRRVSAPLRLAAAALCSVAGAPKLAAQSLAALDLKYILHDTLTGHWLLPALLGAAAGPADLKRWLSGISGLHEEHTREAGESLMLAYYSETYSKVVEFVDFKERLARSHTRALGRAEDAALKLKGAAGGGAPGSGGGGGSAGGTALLLAALEGTGELSVPPLPPQLAPPGQAKPAGLRFNEDLSTRPAWFPPHCEPARLAMAEWWCQWRSVGSLGYAGCWWSEVGAGDASQSAAAREWRAGQLAALTQRWLLPGLLSAALSTRPSPPEVAMLGSLLQQLAAVRHAAAHAASGSSAALPGGAAWEAEMDAGLVQRADAAAQGGASPEAALALVSDVQLALFAAAHAVHAAVAAAQSPAGGIEAAGAASKAASRLEALESLLGALCKHVAASMARPDRVGVMPLGGGFCLASALLCEEGLWVAACLQGWAKLLVQPSGKKSSSAGDDEDWAVRVKGGIHSLAAAAAKGVAEVQAALDALLEGSKQQQVRQLAADLDLFGSGGAAAGAAAKGGDTGTLWGYEPAFKPLEMVQSLVEDQREVLARLQAAGKAVQAALNAVPA